ncbi:hypothetical protein OHS33_13595 [Streptomyces sp. NBC_00536]|uniref:hypothetical protein n=1 Tax=Streptomyces sp. NBC_00536 TaxID=2975769 RepID=UPI002E80051E|nr:hypothetical protein [Streptomyces sp. NBC_00536]WUC79278.1 hypothetical protein OHS33_13595 [Streptomyces sp. NBC_00536]
MDTSWWPGVAAVVAVAVVLLVVGRGTAAVRPWRSAGPGSAGHGPGPPPRPVVRELWCLADGSACLILAVRGPRARVAPVTGKYRDARPGVIALPPGVLGAAHGRAAFLEADRPREVSVWELRRRVGAVDPAVWDQVKGLGLGGLGGEGR